ncbi:hypothetical protein NM208_g6487 [Fusarium decemcellulare]|uniref:Uncharacterized protein n=1 Tax=Fusarium decemcellulare TaxID=57161 RepID=A0ACC1SCX5_9HYPO|nr:hypothetical protein NM208_g6487 [Fusarium decemcellulare]
MESLYSLLSASAIVTQESDPAAFKDLTACWAAQINLKPQAVIVPPDVQSLAKTVQYLYGQTGLDFAFRGQGYCSLPTKDILISMHKFSGFAHDPVKQTITVGAGQTWRAVYEMVDRVAPEYTVIGARTPSVSVGGTIVTAGFSWLSGKFGCISDPHNMIDCEVVKYDGSVVWASSEPELLWAIRGGGGGFGAITNVTFRLHPISRNIYYGTVTAPMTVFPSVAQYVSKFSASSVAVGVSFFMFVEKQKFQTMHDSHIDGDTLVFQLFDPHGEVHGRETFSWALKLPGAKDFTREGNRVSDLIGTSRQYWAPIIVPEFSASQLETCVKWFKDLETHGKSIGENTYMVYELFCTTTRLASPRGCKHMLVIGVGCDVDAPSEEIQSAQALARNAPRLLTGGDPRTSPSPNAIEDWSDMSMIYGDNYKKLLELRLKYDPKRRLKGHVKIVSSYGREDTYH